MNESCALLAPVESRAKTYSHDEVVEFIERASKFSFRAGYQSGYTAGVKMGSGLVSWDPEGRPN